MICVIGLMAARNDPREAAKTGHRARVGVDGAERQDEDSSPASPPKSGPTTSSPSNPVNDIPLAPTMGRCQT